METQELWKTRRQAEDSLIAELKPFADLLSETFNSIDNIIARLELLDDPFGRVCGLVLIKARNLGLGCFSLSLDALAQEAGALFRPLIECLELLIYFRSEPSRINKALEDRLPIAGEIAKKIEGKCKDLREYLNKYASHLSLSPEAMRHLVDFKSGRLRPIQVHKTAVLRENLKTLLAVLVWLAGVAVDCNSIGAGVVDNALVDTFEDIKRRTLLLLDEAGHR